MKIVTAHLKSVSPYSQSRRFFDPVQGENESRDDFARRTWKCYLHVNRDGKVFIPPGSFKNSLAEAAKFLSIKVPGGNKATYTKNFEAGVLCIEPLVLDLSPDDTECEQLFLPSNGIRGSGSRVMKYYPRINEWEGLVQFHVLDEAVLQSTAEDQNTTVFERVLRTSGQLIGIGRWRPRNNGLYGRYEVVSMDVESMIA